MATVAFDGATRYYAGVERPAVDGLDLEVEDGEFLVLVGPSGCGKSTTLRMLAGLEGVDAGRIRIGPDDVTDLPPSRRDLAMVFQNYALYPHMTVADNIGFHLKIAKMGKAEIRTRVEEAADLLDLTPYLDRKPARLSGGQRQRVAMGRAIVRQPRVFCMDEPLSNLDAKLRVSTRTQIASLQRRLGVTTLYVTHDQVEAMTMGHRVAVLKDGVLQQVATPNELFAAPSNIFVAGFIGSPGMNLLRSRVTGGRVSIGGHEVPVSRGQVAALAGEDVVVGLRPESLTPAEEGIPSVVEAVEELGSEHFLFCSAEIETVDPETGDAGPALLTVRGAGARGFDPGARISLRPDPDQVHVFDPATGRRVTG